MGIQEITTNLQKWINQSTTETGFQIPFDFGVDIQTTLYPEVVIGAVGAWRVIDTFSNVYNIPRAKRFAGAAVKENDVTLGKPIEFELLEGEYDNVVLDHQLSIKKVIQNFEVESTGADYIRFFLDEAIADFARAYEKFTVTDFVSFGTDAEDLLVWDTTTKKINIYESLLKVRTQLRKNGSYLGNVDLYVTPEVIAELMKDVRYIAGGIGNIPATEIRNGFHGRILGFNVYEAPRIESIVPSGEFTKKWDYDTKQYKTITITNAINFFAVDNSQIIKVRHMVQPLQMERAPSNYPAECSLFKALEYFKNYVVNGNGIYYGSLTDRTAE